MSLSLLSTIDAERLTYVTGGATNPKRTRQPKRQRFFDRICGHDLSVDTGWGATIWDC